MGSYPPELPPGFDPPFRAVRVGQTLPLASRDSTARAAPQLARQWQALHRAAAAVATLAGSEHLAETDETKAFPELVQRTGDWRNSLARQGVADLAAVMEPGLTALISVHRNGGNPSAAAAALLEEFASARDSLLGLVCDCQDD